MLLLQLVNPQWHVIRDYVVFIFISSAYLGFWHSMNVWTNEGQSYPSLAELVKGRREKTPSVSGENKKRRAVVVGNENFVWTNLSCLCYDHRISEAWIRDQSLSLLTLGLEHVPWFCWASCQHLHPSEHWKTDGSETASTVLGTQRWSVCLRRLSPQESAITLLNPFTIKLFLYHFLNS